MSAQGHRLILPRRVATWQLARSYRLASKIRRAGRQIPSLLFPYQGWGGAKWRHFTGIASGAAQPEALSSCLPFELPAGNSKARAGAAAVSQGHARP